MADKLPYSEFGSGYPYNVYLLVIIPISLLSLGLLNQYDLIVVMMNLPIGMLLYYILFARFSCKVEINDINEMDVAYFFPWDENVLISLEDFDQLSIEKEKNSCYYLLRFSSDEEPEESVNLKLNMRRGTMERMLLHFKNSNKLRISHSVRRSFH